MKTRVLSMCLKNNIYYNKKGIKTVIYINDNLNNRIEINHSDYYKTMIINYDFRLHDYNKRFIITDDNFIVNTYSNKNYKDIIIDNNTKKLKIHIKNII